MTQPGERVVTDDLALLLDALPPRVVESLAAHGGYDDLLEVVLDLGRLPEARFPGRELVLSDEEITEADLQFVVERIGEFGADNRAGIERTLHRISCIRNRRGKIVGLTCRIGRAVYGTIRVIEDLVLSGRSILFLGRPGVGKTTMLREVARVLADDANKRVIIVDTSNEIAGDGDIPHPAIGTARRMQVPTPDEQHAVMIEAVENHMPEVIVIDEIGTELEATAARTIAERGVQLVGTAHGNTLENLMMNPTLSDLVGGIQSVTLGDDEARRRGTQKSILERKAPPTFSIIVEIRDWAAVTIHPDVAGTVDALLRGHAPQPEVREIDETGHINVVEQPPPLRGAEARGEPPESRIAPGRLEVVPGRPTRVLAFGLARNRLDVAAQAVGVPIDIVRTIDEADVVITLRNHYRVKPQAIRQAEERNLPIYVMRANTQHQMEQVLVQIGGGGRRDPLADMYRETEDAIASVRETGAAIDLSPQNGYIRRLQHELAGRYNLQSESAGRDPNRRVRILPEDGGGPRFPESL